MSNDMWSLTTSCWAHKATDRPSAAAVVAELTAITSKQDPFTLPQLSTDIDDDIDDTVHDSSVVQDWPPFHLWPESIFDRQVMLDDVWSVCPEHLFV